MTVFHLISNLLLLARIHVVHHGIVTPNSVRRQKAGRPRAAVEDAPKPNPMHTMIRNVGLVLTVQEAEHRQEEMGGGEG